MIGCLGLAALTPLAQAESAPREADPRHFEYEDLPRTYRLYEPPNRQDGQAAPLLLVLHGGGTTGARMEQLTVGAFNAFASREGFLVAYPDAVDEHWNDGRNVRRYRSHRERIDGVAFLAALIDHLVAAEGADPARVYVAGASSGASMAHRLACERSERVAGIASVMGSMAANVLPECTPTQPVSVLMINGTRDRFTPWQGGEIRYGPWRLGIKSPVPDTVAQWVELNGCRHGPDIATPPDAANDGTQVHRLAYGGCHGRKEVVLYVVQGGGHTWPGGMQYLPERVIGKTCRDIDATALIADFFGSHARGEAFAERRGSEVAIQSALGAPFGPN